MAGQRILLIEEARAVSRLMRASPWTLSSSI
jgi:hypothetical protein